MTIILDGTTGITNDGGYTGDGVVFADGTPTNTLVTTTGGNVGIGTASPSQKLGVNGNIAWGTTGNGRIFSDNNWGCIFQASQASPAQADFMWQNGSGTERMRIDGSGNLLVNTTTSLARATFQATSQSTLCVARTETGLSNNILLNNGNGTVGTIQTNGSSTSYNTSSDYRLKENIAPMTGALDKVQQLKPVTYKWKVDGSDGEGFIAHELAEVCPQAVGGEKDAVDAEGNPVYQGIDTSFLVATLTAAIQELNAKVIELEAKVK